MQAKANLKDVLYKAKIFSGQRLNHIREALCLLILSLCFCSNIFCQSNILGRQINSTVLGVNQEYKLWLPKDYSRTRLEPYPTIYIFDAERNFSFASGVVDFLSNRNIIPKCILVGIINTKGIREKHLLPELKAKDFLNFITKELLPSINENYNTAPYTIFSGHSAGAVFATYAFLDERQFVSAAICSSPIITENNRNLLKEFKNTIDFKNRYFYHSVGDLETKGYYVKQFNDLKNTLKENSNKNLNYKSEIIIDGDHNFVVLPSFYNGLVNLFKDWRIRLSYEIPFNIDNLKNWSTRMKTDFGYEMKIPLSVLIQRGMMLFFDGRTKESVAYFKFAKEQHPHKSEAYLWLAKNFIALDRKKEAIITLKSGIALDELIDNDKINLIQFLKKIAITDQ